MYINDYPFSVHFIRTNQALLLRTRYCEETNRYDFETTGKLYEQVCGFNSGYEEAHFRLARYVDRARTEAVGCKQQKYLRFHVWECSGYFFTNFV